MKLSEKQVENYLINNQVDFDFKDLVKMYTMALNGETDLNIMKQTIINYFWEKMQNDKL